MPKKAKIRPTRPTPRQKNESRTSRRARVPARQPASRTPTTPLATLRCLKNAKTVRAWLGLSLEETGKELARLTRREFPFTKQAVAKMEAGRINGDVLHAYGQLIANRINAQTDRLTGITIAANSPWHITAWRRCADCGAWYPLERITQRRCRRCIEKQE